MLQTKWYYIYNVYIDCVRLVLRVFDNVYYYC